MILLEFTLPGTLHFLCFFSQVREVFSYFSRYFLGYFLSLFSFYDPYNVNIVAFKVVPDEKVPSFFFFFLLCIFCCVAVISTIQSYRSFIHSSASVILLLIPSTILFFQSQSFYSNLKERQCQRMLKLLHN